MEYGNFTIELFGHRQRPWGYEVRADVTYDPTGKKHTLCMTFKDGVPTEQEIITEGKRRLDRVQYKIDNPPDMSIPWKQELKANVLYGVKKSFITQSQALQIKAIVEA